jgi:hypothetical protein
MSTVRPGKARVAWRRPSADSRSSLSPSGSRRQSGPKARATHVRGVLHAVEHLDLHRRDGGIVPLCLLPLDPRRDPAEMDPHTSNTVVLAGPGGVSIDCRAGTH